jgi:hypothetical protein
MSSILPDVERSLIDAAARGRRRSRTAPAALAGALAVAATALVLGARPAPHEPAVGSPTATPTPTPVPTAAPGVIAKLARTYAVFNAPATPFPLHFRHADAPGLRLYYDEARLIAEGAGFRAYAVVGTHQQLCVFAFSRTAGGGGCGKLSSPPGWGTLTLRGKGRLRFKLVPDGVTAVRVTRADGSSFMQRVQRNGVIVGPLHGRVRLVTIGA